MGRRFSFMLIVIIVIFTSACTTYQATLNTQTGIPIDARFTDCYESLGGSTVLGYGTTNIFVRNGILYQYTENALLKYDPQAPAIKKCQLDSLGLQFGINGQEITPPDVTAIPQIYIDGHLIWEEAAPFYKKHGQGIVGVPLTEVFYNPEKYRYEQYFSNLGFYRNENDPVGEIHLMPYGQWYCGEPCQKQINIRESGPRRLPPPASSDELRIADENFKIVADRIGWDMTSLPLTPAFLYNENTIMKIFDNMILIADRDNLGKTDFLAVTESLAIQSGPLMKAKTGCDFYPVKDGLGYNICGEIRDYITAHGTLENTGAPIMEEYNISRTISRQCFTNLCILRHKIATAPASLKIQVQSLGYTYCLLNALCTLDAQVSPTPQPEGIKLQVWEGDSYVSSSQSQIIGVSVFTSNMVPVPDVDVTLNVTMPDGSIAVYRMNPTDATGQTSFKLDPITALNGTLIEYQVCVASQVQPQVCVMESFYIWENP